MATIPRFHLIYDDVETFDQKVVSGVITITPFLDNVIVASDDDLTTLAPNKIVATLTNGVLNDGAGHQYVSLPCDSPLLGLTDPLQYKVSFRSMRTPEGRVAAGFRTFTFEAPSTSTDFNLATATPVTGTPGVGTVRGPAGPPIDGVSLDGDGNVVFTVNGVPVGSPLALQVVDMSNIDGGTPSSPGVGIIDGGTP